MTQYILDKLKFQNENAIMVLDPGGGGLLLRHFPQSLTINVPHLSGKKSMIVPRGGRNMINGMNLTTTVLHDDNSFKPRSYRRRCISTEVNIAAKIHPKIFFFSSLYIT